MVVAISLWLADGDEWAAKADLAGEALVTYGPPVEDCLSELGVQLQLASDNGVELGHDPDDCLLPPAG